MNLSISSVLAASRLQKSSPHLTDLSQVVHFIGIGGIGMSALAELLLARGIKVSGSDREKTVVTQRLEKLGARIAIGHESKNVNGAGSVVVSSAISETNPELIAAIAANLPLWHRADVLVALAEQSKLVAVSGTHGKTTTTGMIAQVLIDAQMDPSVAVGGVFNKIASNARAGKGDMFIAEIDESDGTQVKAKPYISVITNIEADHLENYPGGIAEIRNHMADFAKSTKAFVVLCADDPGCKMLADTLDGSSLITYGKRAVSPDALYAYESTDSFTMSVFVAGKELGQIVLSVPGEHNKLNAMAAVALAMELEIGFDTISKALYEFRGIVRRFDIIGEHSNTLIVDDYAHHPTEVKAVLEAAASYAKSKGRNGRIVAIFQPHQPGRLRDLWDEFRTCFKGADLLLLADVYIARGEAIPGVNSQEFAAVVDHPNALYIGGTVPELANNILPHLHSGDLVLTIGAGNITQLGPNLLELLKTQPIISTPEKSLL